MKKFLGYFLLIALILLGVWYFLIKEEHYRISFTSKQPKALVYHQVLGWQANSENGLQTISLESNTPYSEVIQKVVVADSVFTYRWVLSNKNDSLTQVDVHILDEKNGLAQKFEVPFTNNDFVKRSIKNVKNVGDNLVAHGKKFRVHSIVDTVFPSNYCVYLPLKSKVAEKAGTMLRSIADLMGYINENELSLQGHPYVEVTSWNKKTDIMSYNFCFPISKTDSLPPSESLLFKETPSFKGLRAEFNGNYANSKNAWYYLTEYAELHQIEIKELPTEVYLNDPQSGGNAMDWKAHIFVPIVE